MEGVSLMMRRRPWALDSGPWGIDQGVGEVYAISLSSYFLPLLRRASTPCTTRRSSEGKEIILIGGDSLVVALGP